MKRRHIFLLLGTLLILIGLVVCLLFVFVGMYRSSQDSPETHTDVVSKGDMEQYVIDSWHFHDCTRDEESETLTAIRTFYLTYGDAQKIGSQVFSGDLAPETYLSQAVTMEADLRSRFSTGDLTVVLSFRGSDGAELFHVDSNGNISTCWSSGES